MDLQPNNICGFCGSVARERCARCGVFYCSREHQRQHWPVHKKVCNKPQPSIPVSTNPRNISNEGFLNLPPGTSNDAFIRGIPPTTTAGMFVNTAEAPTDAFINMNLSNVPSESFASLGNWCQNTIPCSENERMNPAALPRTIPSLDTSIMSRNIALPRGEDLFSSLNNEYLTEDTNFWNLINACAQDTVNYSTLLEGNTLGQITNPQTHASLTTDVNAENLVSPDPGSLLHNKSINEICRIIIDDMNKYGICVLDKFIGSNYGNLVLQEVKTMYKKGIFTKGEIVKPSASNESVRSDVITWITGNEPYWKYVGSLMKKLDLIVATCNTVPNNGIFSQYKLHKRTKAMVACYPGDGTHYKKHIDNPFQDGRCITCIYYLNKDWNVKKHGGMLRMFPADSDKVANIQPLFDRLIFFWSDKRNPHEVLPSHAMRFAITLWYFDADEREKALKKMSLKNQTVLKSRNQ